MTDDSPRLGFCCKFIPDEAPGTHPTLKAAKEAALAMNVTSVTIAHLRRLDPAGARDKLAAVVGHNLAALRRQIGWVAARPPLERLLRLASAILPGYTHPEVRDLYADPDFRRSIEAGLAGIGEAARAGGVRLSMHPGPFCILASRNPAALANGIAELDYHAEVMAMMGYGAGWHPHGAHVNIHVGAREPGLAGFRATLPRVSEAARHLVTVENDEDSFGLDDVLELGDLVPVVLDLHHHWIHSRGHYIAPDDPRIARIRESWRGVRPVSHVSVSREDLLVGHDPDALPDFAALLAAGLSGRALAAHSDLMWNRALNDVVALHLAWSDFEIEAKLKNLASTGLARQVGGPLALAAE
ncbi:UV damage repair endonuclease [Methylobacterium sp. 4-46]|uniref:UV damage repair endonuclease n=1 Tax=unclassified Methylobacterium TaxID=2615210 RepID=UPI000152E132|nr:MULTISPECIES: UV damage repair endonuclease [Methylobacterium]ACA21062.1 UV damage repair endonuclease [Methylobacterium sp. 4-46]WFT80211.1 UV damage endonuclease UvsE [Methylobacterium nodulans]